MDEVTEESTNEPEVSSEQVTTIKKKLTDQKDTESGLSKSDYDAWCSWVDC
ncbi:MAG: hypothetical protein ACI4HI_00970 [Lachnospiraceae bacterium]